LSTLFLSFLNKKRDRNIFQFQFSFRHSYLNDIGHPVPDLFDTGGLGCLIFGARGAILSTFLPDEGKHAVRRYAYRERRQVEAPQRNLMRYHSRTAGGWRPISRHKEWLIQQAGWNRECCYRHPSRQKRRADAFFIRQKPQQKNKRRQEGKDNENHLQRRTHSGMPRRGGA
jgi:hypothetical protein